MRLIVVVLLVLALAGPAVPATAAPSRSRVREDVVAALGVLHGWDERRALAWAAADERALRSLYVDGAAVARSDVSLLRAYAARGLVVRRIVTQVFGVVVLRRDPGRMVLLVRDRVAGGVVDDHGRRMALPSTRPVVRRLELRLVGGTWRLATG